MFSVIDTEDLGSDCRFRVARQHDTGHFTPSLSVVRSVSREPTDAVVRESHRELLRLALRQQRDPIDRDHAETHGTRRRRQR
jgi:hypothetical protein